MQRTITPYVLKDLNDKIVIVMGPRQVGKTTLAKSLCSNYQYLNYDLAKHRLALNELSWDRKCSLVIFDELHKMRQWKRWLKGIYDTEGIDPRLLVTGSAQLNAYRKVGDSLAGRYFSFRLHPLDLKEAQSLYPPDETFDRLWQASGFPEPFLRGSKIFYRRWRNTHFNMVLRQDLIDLEKIHDIQAIETLIILLQQNVGSTISYANLARTLERDAKTVKRWLRMLEELYVIFKVTPHSQKISRTLLKAPKYYFYDFASLQVDPGLKLENLVACAILKELHFLEDIYGAITSLNFIRTKDGQEIDFLVTINNNPSHLIEIKWSDDEPSKNFEKFAVHFEKVQKIQLVKELKREKTYRNGIEIRSLINWLTVFDFTSLAS